jgi:hypothetical protein
VAYICSVECSVCSSVGLLSALPFLDDFEEAKREKRIRKQGSREEGREEGRTHHVISNNSPMPIIDLNPINPKDSSHLINNSRSTSFNTIRLEDSVNVGSIQLVQVDKFIG